MIPSSQNGDSIESLQKKYNIIFLSMVIIVSLATVFLFLYSMQKMFNHSKGITIEAAKIMKERDLIDTVNNIIIRIDDVRNDLVARKKDVLAFTKLDMIHGSMNNVDYIDKLESHLFDFFIYAGVNIVIFSNKDEIVYSKNEFTFSSKSEFIESIQIHLNVVAYEIFNIEDFFIVLWIDQQFIKDEVKSYMEHAIHAMQYAENQYVWVNEVLNFSGGDNYAIRRIHPNLKKTEGEYLSTATKDIMGNLPYQVELDGINSIGEITFEYYFKNLVSMKIGKKMSYAKLYTDFNWIVATGVPISEMSNYVSELKESSTSYITTFYVFMGAYSLLFLCLSYYMINRMGNEYGKKINQLVQDETQKDMLTSRFNSKMGNKLLRSAFSDYMRKKTEFAILILDIDDFKQINDTYGHDTGDDVLRKVEEEIESIIGENNKLIRWEAEEFVVICQDTIQGYYKILAEEIVDKIHDIQLFSDGKQFNVSISMGVSLYNKDDTAYDDVLKRAYRALYQIKNNGKKLYKFHEIA